MTKTSEFVCRIGSYSIYYNSRYSKTDSDMFIIKQKDKQVYRTEYLDGAVLFCIGDKKISKKQKENFISLAEKFDSTSVSSFKL